MSLLPEGPREHVRDLDIVFDQEEVHPLRMGELYNFFNVTVPGIIRRAESERAKRGKLMIYGCLGRMKTLLPTYPPLYPLGYPPSYPKALHPIGPGALMFLCPRRSS